MEWCELTQCHQYADLTQLKFLSCTKKPQPLILYVNQVFSNQQDPDSGDFTPTKGKEKVFIIFCLVISFEALPVDEIPRWPYLQ